MPPLNITASQLASVPGNANNVQPNANLIPIPDATDTDPDQETVVGGSSPDGQITFHTPAGSLHPGDAGEIQSLLSPSLEAELVLQTAVSISPGEALDMPDLDAPDSDDEYDAEEDGDDVRASTSFASARQSVYLILYS